MTATAKSLDISAFEEIFAKTNGKDYKSLGQILVTYNPDKVPQNTSIPEDKEIGFGEIGTAHVEVAIFLEVFSRKEPVTFHFFLDEIGETANSEAEAPCSIITSWFLEPNEKANFSVEESTDHPFVLSWVTFMETQEEILDLSADTMENLTRGICWPSHLSVETGIRLLQNWVEWIEKYG